MSTMSAEQARDRALRGGLVFLAARMVLQGFQWIATLLVARLLLPEDYGLMAVVSMVTELAGLLACAGFGSALIQRVTTTREQEGQLFTLSLVLVVPVYAVIWLLAPLIADHLGNPGFVSLLRFSSLLVWLVPLNTVCGSILERDLMFAKLARIHVMTGVLQSVVVLVLAYAGLGAWALAMGLMCGSLTYSFAIWRLSRWRPLLAMPDEQSFGLMRFGATVAFTSLVWFVNSNSDKALVTTLLGPAVLGLYAMAYQLAAMPVDKITSSVNRASFATYGRLRNEPERLKKWYLRVVAALFATAGPALIGAALVSSDALPLLLGEKWRAMVMPFQILAPAGALMAIAATISPLLTALGRPDIPMKYEMTCAVVYPVSILILAQFGGLRGVCLVWILVYPIMVMGLIHTARDVTGITVRDFARELAPFALALLAMAAAVVLVRGWAEHMAVLPRVLLSIGVGAAVYCSAAVLFVGPRSAFAAFEFLRGLMTRKAEA